MKNQRFSFKNLEMSEIFCNFAAYCANCVLVCGCMGDMYA